MKTLRILLAMSLSLTLHTVYPQKVKSFKVIVTLTDNSQYRGYLYSVAADALVIKGEDFAEITLKPETIEELKVRRENSLGRGAWIGALTGLAVGAAAGYASESGSGWEDIGAIGGGIIGAPVGALIGVGIGSFHKRIVIHGDRAVYQSHLATLQKYAPN